VKTFLLLALLLQGSVWTADEHKAAMNDASDLQEDIRDALGATAGDKLSEAGLKMEALMGKTQAYWAAKKQADVVTLAETARALAKQLATEGKASQFDAAAKTFADMNRTCNACHDLHPEKR